MSLFFRPLPIIRITSRSRPLKEVILTVSADCRRAVLPQRAKNDFNGFSGVFFLSVAGGIEWLWFKRPTDGAKVKLQTLLESPSLFDEKTLRELIRLNPSRRAVFYTGYSSTSKKLKEIAPQACQTIGAFSTVLDLEALLKAIENNGSESN